MSGGTYKPVPADVIEEIKDLDSRGYQLRDIAEAVGVSPTTVRRFVGAGVVRSRATHAPSAANTSRRCPECGGKYYGDKCRLCAVRSGSLQES